MAVTSSRTTCWIGPGFPAFDSFKTWYHDGDDDDDDNDDDDQSIDNDDDIYDHEDD